MANYLLELPDELHKEIKLRSVEDDTDMKDIMLTSIKKDMESYRKKKQIIIKN